MRRATQSRMTPDDHQTLSIKVVNQSPWPLKMSNMKSLQEKGVSGMQQMPTGCKLLAGLKKRSGT